MGRRQVVSVLAARGRDDFERIPLRRIPSHKANAWDASSQKALVGHVLEHHRDQVEQDAPIANRASSLSFVPRLRATL